MGINPRIEVLREKKLIGTHLSTSLTHNRTAELWRRFMPRRQEIANALSSDLYTLQVYDPGYFNPFHPAKTFEKWALVEVADFSHVPPGMETFTLPGGLYAVFLHRGSSEDASLFQYIFSTWLPASAYALDDRPHFEVLGEKYRNADPASEEEIWIPIRLRE